MFALAGCGGGGHSMPSSLPGAGSGGGSSTGVLTLTIPAKTAAAIAARSSQSISAETQSAGIAINGAAPQFFNVTPTSGGCALVSGATTCTLTLTAPVGNDAFAITTYSGTNGNGATLDVATMNFVVVANVKFSLSVTLGPVVSVTTDSGPGSLRAAIADANAGDTITFLPGVSGTIALTSGPIALARSVTLSGPGAASLTISGSNSSQIFIVNAGVTAVISGLTLAHGTGAKGGAIANSGTLTVASSTFANNIAPLHGEGGAIYNNTGATLTVSSATFTANKAQFGGAIGSESKNTRISNATFTGNTAIGPSNLDSAYGGAIYSNDDITIAGSTFTANVSGGAGAPAYFGGAIVEDHFTSSGLSLSNSTFTSNKAGVPANGDVAGQGGAIYDDSGGTMTLSADMFGGGIGAGNVASGTSDSFGGAIDAESGTSVSLSAGNIFTHNSVSSQSTSSSSGGGAIEMSGAGDLTITGANTFGSNAVTAGPNATTGGVATGGAIDEENSGAIDLHAAAGTSFSNNSVSATDNLGSANGGAIEYVGNGTPGCCAKTRRPGQAVHRIPRGQRVAAARRSPLQSTAYTIDGVTVTGNAVTGGANPVFNVSGGGFDISVNTTPITVSNSTFTSNVVSAGFTAFGGAVTEDGATLTLLNDQISGNSATQVGGGTYVTDSGTMNVTNCTITGNHVTNENHGAQGGGGVAAALATLTVSGSTIANNSVSGPTAGSGGGGVQTWANVPETATIVNSTITGNTSAIDGGGIENLDSYTLTLINVTVYANSAPSGSGGSLSNTAIVNAANTIFAAGSASIGADIVNTGTLTSTGFNWIQTNVVGPFAPLGSDHVNAGSPQLSAAGLQNNGGPTQTIADALTSPVTHAIPFAGGVCGASGPALDQRGFTRGTAASCDIGAYEFSGLP